MSTWECLVIPPKEAPGLEKDSDGLAPDPLTPPAAEGWEAVWLSINPVDLTAWPPVLPERPVESNGLPGPDRGRRWHEAGAGA